MSRTSTVSGFQLLSISKAVSGLPEAQKLLVQIWTANSRDWTYTSAFGLETQIRWQGPFFICDSRSFFHVKRERTPLSLALSRRKLYWLMLVEGPGESRAGLGMDPGTHGRSPTICFPLVSSQNSFLEAQAYSLMTCKPTVKEFLKCSNSNKGHGMAWIGPISSGPARQQYLAWPPLSQNGDACFPDSGRSTHMSWPSRQNELRMRLRQWTEVHFTACLQTSWVWKKKKNPRDFDEAGEGKAD